ncbi:MAG: adenosylcobinamide-GDP ribazoletransferase [Thermoplasmata archaeon]|nr:adenosylcobinamide-GDP ribazoletransferase [Thermoplasmata archaeon]
MTRALLGLLTRIRLPGLQVNLEAAAKQQYLFPLVGLLVGLIAALICISLDLAFGDGDPLILGGLLLVALYAVTGIIHTEGLADLADGVMASGPREKRREVMKDPRAGVAAVIAVAVYLLLFFALAVEMCARAGESVTILPIPWHVPFALGFVVSEVSGKLAMNTSMLIGPSAHQGMGSVFVENATARRFAVAVVLAGVVGLMTVGLASILLLVGVAGGAAVTIVARKHLGGVSGDVFGAANEVGRLSALLLWVLII